MIEKNWIEHFKNFLNINKIEKLNSEIDEISKSYLINGVTRASTWVNKNLCEVNTPIINIKKINLLEIAFKIYKELIKKTSKKFTLSGVRVIEERKNSHPINWHTDKTKGIIRAIVYLKGGDQNNGNLSYVKESHLKVYGPEAHKIDPIKEGLINKIVSLDTKVGDLIYFDINGIHKKNTVAKERRVLFFEFHDGQSEKPFGQVIFDNNKVTKEIKDDINFLFPDKNENIKSSSIYSETLPDETPLKVFYYYFKNFNKIFLRKFKKKFFKF